MLQKKINAKCFVLNDMKHLNSLSHSQKDEKKIYLFSSKK